MSTIFDVSRWRRKGRTNLTIKKDVFDYTVSELRYLVMVAALVVVVAEVGDGRFFI
jgi:hypothetical protein